jgi:S-adenosylmethionine synthetase
LHHNIDKVLIIAGKSKPEYGGGAILVPPSVIIGGRATKTLSRPVNEVIEETVADFLNQTIGNLKDFKIEPRAEEGAPELRSLIGRGANDTSIGVGFSPLNFVEQLVINLEKYIKEVYAAGEDIKIMAIRVGHNLRIVLAVAMVSKYISSREEYEEAKLKVAERIKRIVDAEVNVNCADSGDNIYLTVTGTSIEMGDDGATGRGNRGNGLITPMRPMTMEAIAGKNPVSHVGKIYNVLAQKAAGEITEINGIKEAYVTLVSKIGLPLNQPLLQGVRIHGDLEPSLAIESSINSILNYWLEEIDELVEEFVKGTLTIY